LLRARNPLKQGLKLLQSLILAPLLCTSRPESIKTRIETTMSNHIKINGVELRARNPLKQGLKLLYSGSMNINSLLRARNPLKQGLKPRWSKNKNDKLASSRPESIKTRIET